MREQFNINVALDNGAFMPQKAYDDDAGFDLRTPVEFDLVDTITIDTGVHMAIPSGYVGFLKSKSGLNVNYGIMCEGVVDSGYTGSIVAKMFNNGYKQKHFNAGDKITQIVILPIPDVTLVQVDKLDDNTARGNKGFGSSGR